MDTDTYSDDEDIPAPPPDEPAFTSYGGGMFAGSQYFTIAGGTFSNIIQNYHAVPTVPPDFRMIPMGDIDLQQELMMNEKSGVVDRRQERHCVRRVYSAKIDSRRSNVTVAVYQGDGAEEDWRRDVEKYMLVRHPNILQIWGGASYGNIYATVFHGDLVPFEQFLVPQSPIMTVYIYAYYAEEWERVEGYLQTVLHSWEHTMWIRTSTGRLYVDLVSLDQDFVPHRFTEGPLLQAATPLNVTDIIAIESLGLAQYHNICSLYLRRYRIDSISTSVTVHIGVVTSWPSGHPYEGHVEIALPAGIKIFFPNGWCTSGDGEGDLMGNGWTRYRADDLFDSEIVLLVSSYHPDGWLSQANHIFHRLQITFDLENYALIESVYFVITVGNAGQDSPLGYLFFCPSEDFRAGPTSVRRPDCPAYWSLDPSGVDRLSTEEAARLGFPPFQLTTQVEGQYWDANVYAGLRQFHQAKRFNPESQDIALHLGYTLYELCGNVNSPFAHMDNFDEAEETAKDADTDDEWADAQSSMHEDSGSDADSGATDGVDQDSICAEPQAPEVDQELMDGGYTDTNHEAHLKSRTANDHPTANNPPTGGGFIHRIFGALRHSLVVETNSDNIETDPISPFPI